MVLKGYLYEGMSLCSFCGFNIFDLRAVCSMDDCHLFLSVLSIIPLILGMQMQLLVPSPMVLSSGGSPCTAPKHRMGVETDHYHS